MEQLAYFSYIMRRYDDNNNNMQYTAYSEGILF
jgi:hypothetical protein